MIQLSEHFTTRKLLRFTVPSMVMMIFTSIYGVVDGLFVSNYVGKTPFAAVNFIMPFLMLFSAIGFMIGTGGSAIVSRTLGEGERERANDYFSMLVWVSLAAGLVVTLIALLTLRPVAAALGAEGELLEGCVLYGRVILPALPFFILQYVFQSFLVTAERPHLGLAVTVAAGLTNIVFDAVLVAGLRWGLVGAAIATAGSQVMGGLVPLLYFLRPNSSTLRLRRAPMNGAVLLRTCLNGSSELMTNLSMSLVNMLYNFQLMRLIGEDGVAAYGVIMYVNFIFVAVFIGYSIGSAPVVGFHFGAGNTAELKGLLRRSVGIVGVFSVALTGIAILLAGSLSHIFVGYDAALYELTCRAFRLYALSFLCNGFNIFGSGFFTALNNGVVSAIISFLRTLLFQIVAVLLLPALFGIDGIWLAVVAAELAALLVTSRCFVAMRPTYHYY